MAASGKGSGRQPLFGAVIPLAKAVRLDREMVMDGLREVVGYAGARARLIEEETRKAGLLAGLRGKPTTIRVEIGGVRLAITAAARPLCDATAIHSFVNPGVWRGPIGGLKDHRSHLLIAEEEGNTGTGTDAMFDRATAVTLATAAMASMVEPEGVIWLPARNALPMSVFGTEIERFIDGQAPLQFWIRCQVLPAPVQAEHEFGKLSGEALEPGVATTGLVAFIGAEIIAPPSKYQRDTMLDLILGLASSVIDENAVLRNGGVYSHHSGQLVLLTMRQAGQYSDRPYWELVPKSDPAAQPAGDGGRGPSPEADPEPAPEGAPDPTVAPRLRLVVPGR